MILHIDGPTLSEPISCTVTQQSVVIGRSQTSDVQLPFAMVSSAHLRLERQQDGQYFVCDLGSTNGTTLDNVPLMAHQPVALHHGMILGILTLRLEIDVHTREGRGFTLGEQDTFVRKIVSGALQYEHKEDQAFFEITSGAHKGHRAIVPDDVMQWRIGSAKGADFTLPTFEADYVAHVTRSSDCFFIEPVSSLGLSIDRVVQETKARLHTRQRLMVGAVHFIFFDPLQEYLENLEALDDIDVRTQLKAPSSAESFVEMVEPSENHDTSIQETASSPTKRQGLSRPWELGIVIMTLVFILAGLFILLVLFDVIAI